MRRLLEQAARLDEFFSARGWRACIIGGIATVRWGEVRATHDVDATVYTGFQDEDEYISTILAAFAPRIPDAAAFARANRVVLARGDAGIGIDIALGGLPFEEGMVDRATRGELAPGVFARTPCAEDLVVMKAFADRPRDWIDITGIIVRQGPRLDWAAVIERLTPLAELKEAPEIMAKLEEARREAET